MDRLCMGCMKMYDDQFDVCPFCGYAFDTPAEQSYHIPPGSVLKQRFIVGKVLGFGGFGVTYVGWDYLMERKVAIKEYLPSEFATRMPTQQKITVYSGDKEEQFREGLAKTLEEAKRLAKFEAVPGIVQIYDCFEANGTSYIVMEYLEGVSLKKYLETHGKIPPEQAIPVILQVASAMEEVHKAGILHRDIAPDNIYVLNPDEPEKLEVKLLDFGAARYATTKHSKSLSVIIKPGYAPEEQYRSRGDQGTWTDVYALAATLYKMLTGITPEDAMERSVKDEVKKPSKLGVKIPKPMETALMNAMNVKIQDRTQTMEEFSQELMAAEVKEREKTKNKEDVGSVPKWVLALAGTGIAAAGIVIALMVSGVIKFGLLAQDTSKLEMNTARVPNVVNKDADEAENLLKAEALGMSRDKMVYSSEIPQDMVSYQEQTAGSVLPVNTVVVVEISMGKEKAVFPSVVGLKKEEAQKTLQKAGFQNIRFVDGKEEGVLYAVLESSHKTGDNVELDQEIVLTICVKEGGGGDAAVQVRVPDVVGKQREEANRLLTAQDFKISWLEEVSDQPAGTVLSQVPKAGEEANKGSFVTVRISSGAEKIYMKNVMLMSEAEARETIEALGLAVGTVTEEYSDSVAAGKVISQSIPQDAEVEKGETIDLVISKGQDPSKQQREAQPTSAARQEDKRQQEEAARQQEEARKQQEEAARQEEARRQQEEARRQQEQQAAEAQRQAEEAARREAEEAARRQREAEEAARKASEEANQQLVPDYDQYLPMY